MIGNLLLLKKFNMINVILVRCKQKPSKQKEKLTERDVSNTSYVIIFSGINKNLFLQPLVL